MYVVNALAEERSRYAPRPYTAHFRHWRERFAAAEWIQDKDAGAHPCVVSS